MVGRRDPSDRIAADLGEPQRVIWANDASLDYRATGIR
jgi:hypothetical protein